MHLNSKHLILHGGAMRVLNAGMDLWDRFRNSEYGYIRRRALAAKTRALCNHDRVLNGEFERVE